MNNCLSRDLAPAYKNNFGLFFRRLLAMLTNATGGVNAAPRLLPPVNGGQLLGVSGSEVLL